MEACEAAVTKEAGVKAGTSGATAASGVMTRLQDLGPVMVAATAAEAVAGAAAGETAATAEVARWEVPEVAATAAAVAEVVVVRLISLKTLFIKVLESPAEICFEFFCGTWLPFPRISPLNFYLKTCNSVKKNNLRRQNHFAD